MRQKEISELISELRDSNPHVRRDAAYDLGFMKDSRAEEPLIASLEDKNYSVRDGAAEALGLIKDSRAVVPLIPILKDSDYHVRDGAVHALHEINDARAIEPLGIVALYDQNASVRRHAVDALVGMDDPRAVAVLLSVLSKTKDTELIASEYVLLLRQGIPDSEAQLVEALDSFGNQKMAEDFINCGSSKLRLAAEKWASQNGYKIISVPDQGGPKWGEAQRR
jgi:HEAT repeat protein